jgi:hypothetical protein
VRINLNLKNAVRSIKEDRISNVMRIVLLCILVGIGFGAFHVYHIIHPTLYVAAGEGFEINFPATPTINNLPSQSDGLGGKETGKIYQVSAANAKSAGYIIYVNHYSGNTVSSFTKSETTEALEENSDHMAGILGANITQPQITSFKSTVAAEATLVPTTKGEGSIYLLSFLKGNNAYIILGSGMTKSRFNSFTNSFQFLN